MRVLVVEDNPDMGPYLKQGLREHGFAVDLVTDGNPCPRLCRDRRL